MTPEEWKEIQDKIAAYERYLEKKRERPREIKCPVCDGIGAAHHWNCTIGASGEPRE